jgi:hypothetical protein
MLAGAREKMNEKARGAFLPRIELRHPVAIGFHLEPPKPLPEASLV